MPRHKRFDRPKGFHVRVPTSVYEKMREHLTDPFTNTIPHGAVSSLIEYLLRDWIREKDRRAAEEGDEVKRNTLDDLLSE